MLSQYFSAETPIILSKRQRFEQNCQSHHKNDKPYYYTVTQIMRSSPEGSQNQYATSSSSSSQEIECLPIKPKLLSPLEVLQKQNSLRDQVQQHYGRRGIHLDELTFQDSEATNISAEILAVDLFSMLNYIQEVQPIMLQGILSKLPSCYMAQDFSWTNSQILSMPMHPSYALYYKLQYFLSRVLLLLNCKKLIILFPERNPTKTDFHDKICQSCCYHNKQKPTISHQTYEIYEDIFRNVCALNFSNVALIERIQTPWLNTSIFSSQPCAAQILELAHQYPRHGQLAVLSWGQVNLLYLPPCPLIINCRFLLQLACIDEDRTKLLPYQLAQQQQIDANQYRKMNFLLYQPKQQSSVSWFRSDHIEVQALNLIFGIYPENLSFFSFRRGFIHPNDRHLLQYVCALMALSWLHPVKYLTNELAFKKTQWELSFDCSRPLYDTRPNNFKYQRNIEDNGFKCLANPYILIPEKFESAIEDWFKLSSRQVCIRAPTRTVQRRSLFVYESSKTKFNPIKALRHSQLVLPNSIKRKLFQVSPEQIRRDSDSDIDEDDSVETIKTFGRW